MDGSSCSPVAEQQTPCNGVSVAEQQKPCIEVSVEEQQTLCNEVSVGENEVPVDEKKVPVDVKKVPINEKEVPVDEKPHKMTDTGEEELTLVGVNKRVDAILGSIQTIIQVAVEAAVQEGPLSPAALLVARERALDDDDDDYGDDHRVVEPPTTVTTVPSKDSRSEQLESRLQPLYVTERYNPALFRYQIVKEPKQESKWSDGKPFAIRTRISRFDGSESYFLDIKTSSLQAELKAVLGNIPNVNLDITNPEVELKVFYHCIWKLLEYRNKVQGGESVEDKKGDEVEGDKKASNGGLPKESLSEEFELLIYWAEKYYNLVQADLDAVVKRGKIRFDLLWALFKPDSVLFSRDPHLGVPLCATYISGLEKTDKHGQPFFEIVSVSLGRADNGKPGYATRNITIPCFWGEKEIKDVEAYPLEHHAHKEQLRENMITRGHQYVGLAQARFTHLAFDGTCFFINAKNQQATQYDNHRIMVDAYAFAKFAPAKHPVLDTVPYDKEWNKLEPDELLICNPTVFAYMLHMRRFAEVGVDQVSPIQWNESASFENDVILRAREKKAITAVALQTLGKPPASNEAVGQFMVFHGGPGVGKTLTANVLAEQHKKVLYEFSASKHESGAENLERDVDIVLILCNRWKAVLLMDEGDVYLARRDENHDHAAVVAVFLRHIERYSGLLIVTTNRWNIIDPAIKSRVTLPVKYPSMSDDHQVALWRGMLANMGHNGRLSDDEITKMAALQLWNGRQIKNCMKLAGALAGEASLAFEHLQEAAQLQMEDSDEDEEDEQADVEVQE